MSITLTVDAKAMQVEALQRRSRLAMQQWLDASDPAASAFWFASMESFARQARLLANPVTLAVTAR